MNHQMKMMMMVSSGALDRLSPGNQVDRTPLSFQRDTIDVAVIALQELLHQVGMIHVAAKMCPSPA